MVGTGNGERHECFPCCVLICLAVRQYNSGMATGRKRDPRYDAAVEMYNKGLSIKDVAVAFGVTRQTMWETLKCRGVKMRSVSPHGSSSVFYRGALPQEGSKLNSPSCAPWTREFCSEPLLVSNAEERK